jgi:hypothetical protein
LSAVQKIHREWWEWIFSTDDNSGHPLKGNHAVKKASTGEYLLGGTLPNAGTQRRRIKLPEGAKVFVPVDNVLCTETEGDSKPLDTACAEPDADGAQGHVSATLNGNSLNVDRVRSHSFSLNIRKRINGTRRNRTGDPLGTTDAAADGYYVMFDVPPFPKERNYHELKIVGRQIELIYRIEP